MAQGNLSPRQKMINLMYLIFIAMLALNMSKEVLSAFGLMNEKLTESNEAATERNVAFMAGLEQQANEQPDKYLPLKAQAEQVSKLATDFNTYLEDLKGKMTATVDDPEDYEIMDKGDFLDKHFFIGEKLKPEGQAFIDQMKTFREGIQNVIGESYPGIAADVQKKFATDDVTNRDNNVIPWLDYHYKGFPLVASLTKMTQLQADVKTTESEVMSTMLQGKLKIEASLTNFDAIVVPDKTAFFSGENFTGKIILGKKDNTLRADKVVVNGQELSAESMQDGKTILEFPAGSVGEREIKGEFYFTEGGETFTIPINSTYAVVPKPNSATISADKMNVVYRGVKNPMTISFAGVSDNNVSASAPGLSKISGVSKYIMDVTSVKGREVTINVTGTLPDGQKVSDAAKFRIKDLPKPIGTVRGEDGSIKMQRNSLEISTIGAKFDDFDFELPLNVRGFKFKVPGQPTIEVSGSKLNDRAKNALRKAKRGSDVQIFDIDAKASGVSVILKKVSPVIIELTN
ncbi:gliding motility protein GldM [Yeosuana sp. MJ-SS3]|uniref:Gliding motility protein GldM n=1 Tax=Gilvirhabdus luticola TaxID=3079858 RepID=A0ABU3U5W9_9FLAO|nr:gliding motility protein GldM [Yeosuana sp. MJ-SS3]MDU8885717.1 gliding motility protein GldM [Yeosuana sp. MJ-SS3]